MLRDCGSALILVALTGPFYALGIYLSPSPWSAGYAFDLLVLLSVVLTVTGFVVEFRASRLSRRLREGGQHSTIAVNAWMPSPARRPCG